MALPISITAEKQQLKTTLQEDLKRNPPSEILAYEKFEKHYAKLEAGNPARKLRMDEALFEFHKNNQVSYAFGLFSIIKDMGITPHDTNPQVSFLSDGIDTGLTGSFTCAKSDGGLIDLIINKNQIVIMGQEFAHSKVVIQYADDGTTMEVIIDRSGDNSIDGIYTVMKNS